MENFNEVANLAQFEELIVKYLSITLDDINKTGEFIDYEEAYCRKCNTTAGNLTGYGSFDTCVLCKSAAYIDSRCKNCAWYFFEPNFENEEYPCSVHISYFRIHHAKIPEQLLIAFHKRAAYMINQLEANGIECNFYQYQTELEETADFLDLQTIKLKML